MTNAKTRKTAKTGDTEVSTDTIDNIETGTGQDMDETETTAVDMDSADDAMQAESADSSATGIDAKSDAHVFRLVNVWPTLSAEDAKDIGEFWRREKAIDNSVDAQRRLSQVVAFARTEDGQIAGVCTAVAKVLPRFGQPMYFWRAFIGQDWRASHPNLVMNLLKRSCALLENFARERNFPCIGVLLELENPRFRETLRKPVWWNPPFCFAGKSARGLDLRVLYFHGANLKNPQQMQQLRMPVG